MDRAPGRVRQHVPVVGLRPRDVDEVGEQRVGRALPDEPRSEIEVVVVEEHGRLWLALELGEHGLREARVHLRIAVVPGVLVRDVEGGLVREIPEVVLKEPEHGVRDDVVVAVVRSLVVGHEAQPERRPVVGRSSTASPPASAATTRSSSLIALAIQVTSWCDSSPRSAVTSPPAPRLAVRSPLSSRPYVTGPRLETRISFLRPATTAGDPTRGATLQCVGCSAMRLAPNRGDSPLMASTNDNHIGGRDGRRSP